MSPPIALHGIKGEFVLNAKAPTVWVHPWLTLFKADVTM